MQIRVQFNNNEIAFDNKFEAFQVVSDTPVSNYDDVINKPSINGVELKGNLTFENLGISEISNTTIKEIADTILFRVETISST